MPDVPRHLALIPDGNRRWARARGEGAEAGHRAGMQRVGQVADAAFAAGVEVVSFWWGSPANLTRRDPAEVAGIVKVLNEFLGCGANGLLSRHGAQFEAIGRWRELCPGLEAGVDAACDAAGSGPPKLVLLMAYDGRDELRAAAEALGGGGPREADFEAALWTGHLPPVDLLIRTGGEPHLSAAFLLWRLAEAQLAFPEMPWPDFGPEQLREQLDRYSSIERRFGR